MGETDLILGSKGFSFQTSAAVRTATPYYEHDPCELVPLIYDRNTNAAAAADGRAATTKTQGETNKLVPEPQYTPTGRFPEEGTDAFKEICSWTDPIDAADAHCTVFVKPHPEEHEGLAMWVSAIGAGYIIAKQKKCKFKLSYGDVDLSDIIKTTPFIKGDHVDYWKVPSNFQCNVADACYELYSAGSPSFPEIVGVSEENFPFAEVPVYRKC